MKVVRASYDKVPHISKKDLAYISDDPSLKAFYQYEFAFDSFKQMIADRKQFPVDRVTLVDSLMAQYKEVKPSGKTLSNIESLKDENTFTIITAHQPSLLTGPLYFIYKICSVINLTTRLKKDFSEHNFVPVFICGAEDHDFEEINHLSLFGKTIEWENDEQGAVGRMTVTGISAVIDQVAQTLGDSENANKIISIFREAEKHASNYVDFVFRYVNELFKSYGLVIANMDNAALKRVFIPQIKEEILESKSEKLVAQTSEALNAIGFKSQATPREINFFYLQKNSRERIVREGELYKVLNTDVSFSKEEMLAEIENHPERFSPNVVMRPLYQERILPNLAYVGGGGELAYWMERKSQFEAFNIFYPMLIRRNSVQWMDSGIIKQQGKIGFDSLQLLSDEQFLINSFIADNASENFDIEKETNEVGNALDSIASQAKAIEGPLEKYVLAEKAKLLKMVGHIESKLSKAIKQKHDVSLNKIKGLKSKIFPSTSLQERKNNFLPQYLKHGDAYFDFLIEHLDPFDKHYLIVEED